MVVAALALAACKQEIQFTRIPLLGVLDTTIKPNETSVFLSIPADLSQVVSAAEHAIGEAIRSRDLVEDIACDRRGGNAIDCNDAVVQLELTRNGAVGLSAEGHALQVTMPFKYSLTAKGQGWAAYLTASKSGEVTASALFDLTLSPGFRIEARMGRDIVWSERTIPVLKGKVSIARLADAKLKALLKSVTEPLREALAEQPIREASNTAWHALHEPIEVGRAPDLWLRALPERLMGAGFGLEDRDLVYRVRIDARVALHRGGRPAALHQKPMPEPLREVARPSVAGGDASAPARTVLRLPVEVAATALNKAVAAAFPPSDVIETQASPRSSPVKVRAVKADLVPALEKLALRLQFDVVEPARLFGLTGKAYFVGKPVLDAASGIIELADIGFPPNTSRSPQGPPGLHIGEEPFASRLKMAARVEVGPAISEMMTRINERIEQQLGKDVVLRGRFDEIHVISVEPVEGAFRINVALSGGLSLHYAVKRASKLDPTGTTSGAMSGATTSSIRTTP